MLQGDIERARVRITPEAISYQLILRGNHLKGSFLTTAGILIMLLEALFGPLWVWLVINEAPSFETLLGGTTILVALAVMSIAAIRQGMKTNPRIPT